MVTELPVVAVQLPKSISDERTLVASHVPPSNALITSAPNELKVRSHIVSVRPEASPNRGFYICVANA